jgi:hypothetical protein
MHLPRLARPGLPTALREARDTYRAFSGAAPQQPSPAPAPTPATPAVPTTPAAPTTAVVAPRRSLVERAREAARPLGERLTTMPVRREDPDVVLDIPRLHVDEVDLKLDELKARVALEAHVLDLLQLDVGVDAELRGVGLRIAGVDAEAHLRVRLDNLTVILDRVMNTIDNNPQLLNRLVDRLGDAAEGLAGGAGAALGEIGQGAGSAVHEVGDAARALAPQPPPSNGGPHA